MFPNESNKKLLLKTKREELLEIDKSITSLYSHKKKVESKDEGKKLTVAQQREKRGQNSRKKRNKRKNNKKRRGRVRRRKKTMENRAFQIFDKKNALLGCK